jgi:hypothetical protein
MTFLILLVCAYLLGCATAARFSGRWVDDEPVDYDLTVESEDGAA